MESPVIYAFNCIVADAPWYVMGCVPFWESKRVKKGTVFLFLLVILVLRFTGAYLITAYTQNWYLWEISFVLLLYLVMLSGFVAAAGASFVKVVYIFLMLFVLATFTKFLTGFLIAPLIPPERLPHDTLRYAVALSALQLLIIPFVYRTFRRLIIRAFSELPDRTILMLCFTPIVFYVLNPLLNLTGIGGLFAFIRVAVSLVGFAACYFNVFMMLDATRYIQTEKTLLLEKRLAQESYERVEAHLREVAGLKHDMKKHLVIIRVYLEHERTDEARDYLARYAERSAAVTETQYSGHFLMNAVAGELYQRAGEHGIKVELSLNAAPEHIAAPDLYSLLSNLTDNAIEACLAMPAADRERFIRLTVTKREPYLNICCVNSKSGPVVSRDGKIRTTKADDGHGYGLWTIERVVDAYDGIMNITYDEKTFTVTLALKDHPDREKMG